MKLRNLISNMKNRFDALMWRYSFLRTDTKLLCILILTQGQRLSFVAIDIAPAKLWSRQARGAFPLETQKLLFNTDSSFLTEPERAMKLWQIQSRAKHILSIANCYIPCLQENEVSKYTGWEKDHFEKLLERTEHGAPFVAESAKLELVKHTKLRQYLEFQAKAGRHELVNKILSVVFNKK